MVVMFDGGGNMLVLKLKMLKGVMGVLFLMLCVVLVRVRVVVDIRSFGM